MESKSVNVVLTNNALLKNELIRRWDKKQHRDDVTATLLSNGTISFNYTKDGKEAFKIDLCDCDEISISTSSNHTLCIKTGFNVNHLTLNNKSTAEHWYDTIVEELNKLGYNFNMEVDKKNRRRASEILIRPKTSIRRKKAISGVPNPDGYSMYMQSVERPYELIGNTANINKEESQREYNYDNVNSSMVKISKTNIKKELDNKHSRTIRPLPDPPNEKQDYEVDLYADGNKTDGPVEPIASVDRLEPVASADDIIDYRIGQDVRVTVTDGKMNSTEILNDRHQKPHLKSEKIASVSSKLKENQNSTILDIRTSKNSKKSGGHINTNDNNVGGRGNSRKNTEHLMREMSQESIMISISKKELEEYVVLAMMTSGKLFIARWKNVSLNHPLYEGDMILTINKQRIECIEDALKTIRNTATDKVDLVIVRLPYAKVVVIDLQKNQSDFGFKLEGRTVASVDEEGLAAMHGLRLNTPKAKQFGSFTETCVTAINCLPVNQHFTNEQTMELLSMHRDFVSLVVQPLDLITCLQRQQIDSLET
ncbi:uncharacterized protein LOC117107081 isoform X2 [Anneissia japonica]|nr:uncharacterized protein LOC117107081 isoform X2 [Anneissia japonica]